MNLGKITPATIQYIYYCLNFMQFYFQNDYPRSFVQQWTSSRTFELVDCYFFYVHSRQPTTKKIFVCLESELQMRSLCGGHLPADHKGVVKPDVAGISRLLRMVRRWSHLWLDDSFPTAPKASTNVKQQVFLEFVGGVSF